MESGLIVNEHLIIPDAELEVSVSRSSGPGGQHVNKTSSRVSLRWNVKTSSVLGDEQKAILFKRLSSRLVGEGEILIHVESERSQQKNRRIARERLAQLIKNALKPLKKRTATKPTLGSKKQRLKNKKLRGLLKKSRKPAAEY